MKHLFLLFLTLASISPQAQTYKVMSYNLKFANEDDGENSWSKRKTKIFELINYYAPDILNSQEGIYSQLTEIENHVSYFAPFEGKARDDGDKKGEYTAIFYNKNKFHLEESNTFWLSSTPYIVSKGWDAAYRRICTYVLLKDKTTQKKLWVIDVHFDNEGEIARKESAKMILELIKKINAKLNYPIIFTGDLNAHPKDEPIKILSKELNIAKEISQTPFYGPSGTFEDYKTDSIITEQLDYIFVHKFNVLNYRHIDDRRDDNYFPSDHLPVFSEIQIQK